MWLPRVGDRDVRFLTTYHRGDRAATGDCPCGFPPVGIIEVRYYIPEDVLFRKSPHKVGYRFQKKVLSEAPVFCWGEKSAFCDPAPFPGHLL